MAYKVRIDSFGGAARLAAAFGQPPESGHRSHLHHPDRRPVSGRSVPDGQPDLDVASDFLLVASTLLEIKAESLLPRERDAVQEGAGGACAQRVLATFWVERLLAYKQYKNAASALQYAVRREGMHARPLGPDACFLEPHARLPEGRHARRAGALAARALARRDVFLLESSISQQSPFPSRCTCVPFISASATRRRSAFRSWSTRKRPRARWWSRSWRCSSCTSAMVKIRAGRLFGDIDIRFIEGVRRSFAGRRGRPYVGRGRLTCSKVCRKARSKALSKPCSS